MNLTPFRLRTLLSPAVLLTLIACGSGEPSGPGADAGTDAGADAGVKPVFPGEWKVHAPMKDPRRSELGAGVIDGKIYVAGGRLDNDFPLELLEIYDPATDSWTPGPSMPAPRDHAGVAAVNGKLYVIGGYGPRPDAFSRGRI